MKEQKQFEEKFEEKKNNFKKNLRKKKQFEDGLEAKFYEAAMAGHIHLYRGQLLQCHVCFDAGNEDHSLMTSFEFDHFATLALFLHTILRFFGTVYFGNLQIHNPPLSITPLWPKAYALMQGWPHFSCDGQKNGL